MPTGVEKARVLLSLLKDQGKDVLNHMAPENARVLASSIEAAPDYGKEILDGVVAEVLRKIERVQHKRGVTESLSRFQGLPKPGPDQMESVSFTPSPSSEENFSLGNFDDSSFEEGSTTESEAIPKEPPGRFDNITGIAAVLSEQKLQIIAFVLHYVDELTREKLWGNLPKTIQEKLYEKNIEDVPMSPKIAETLLDSLIKEADKRKAEFPEKSEASSEDDIDYLSESTFSELESSSPAFSDASEELPPEIPATEKVEESIFRL